MFGRGSRIRFIWPPSENTIDSFPDPQGEDRHGAAFIQGVAEIRMTHQHDTHITGPRTGTTGTPA